ncbi:MAG: PAS domain-containing protein, partial [Clostridia bacterium]|nr:PAS domain-containing protein [Clostridia bacterium]
MDISRRLQEFRNCYDNSPLAFCIIKAVKGEKNTVKDFEVIYANQKLADIGKTDISNLIGQHVSKLYDTHDNVHNDFISKLNALNEGDYTFSVYYPKTEKYWNIHCYNVDFGYGCIINETTEKQSLQLDLKDTLNTFDGGFCILKCTCAEDLDVIYISDGFCRMFGKKKDEAMCLYKRHIYGGSNTDTAEECKKIFINNMFDGAHFTGCFRIVFNSDYKWIKFNGAVKKQSSHFMYYINYTDITKQIGNDTPLKSENDTYKSVTEDNDINIWQYDIVNDEMYNTENSLHAHFQDGHMIMKNFLSNILKSGKIRPDCISSFKELYDSVKHGKKKVSADIWFKTSDDMGWWCERTTYFTLFNEDGMPISAIGIGKDVTEDANNREENEKIDIIFANSDLMIWEYNIFDNANMQQPKIM